MSDYSILFSLGALCLSGAVYAGVRYILWDTHPNRNRNMYD